MRWLEPVLVLFYELCHTLSDPWSNLRVLLLIRLLCVPDAELTASELMSSQVAPSSPLGPLY